jgi:hypothetical protein
MLKERALDINLLLLVYEYENDAKEKYQVRLVTTAKKLLKKYQGIKTSTDT